MKKVDYTYNQHQNASRYGYTKTSGKVILPRGKFHNDERKNTAILNEYAHNDEDTKDMKKKTDRKQGQSRQVHKYS